MSKLTRKMSLGQDNSYHLATHDHNLNQISNPTGDKEFNFANKHLHFKWVAPASGAHEGAFEIEASGGFSGDLIHVHQHTGNVGANTFMIFVECEDADASCLHLVHGGNVLDFGVNGLQLSADARITEFDTDITLAGGDTKVPTDDAVKGYVALAQKTIQIPILGVAAGFLAAVDHGWVWYVAMTDVDANLGGTCIVNKGGTFKVGMCVVASGAAPTNNKIRSSISVTHKGDDENKNYDIAGDASDFLTNMSTANDVYFRTHPTTFVVSDGEEVSFYFTKTHNDGAGTFYVKALYLERQ